MTLKELIAQFRIDHDDTKKPYLWSDDAIRAWLNEAEREACRRGKLLVDSTTTEICYLTVAKGDPWLPYDQRIIRVLRAMPEGTDYVRPIPVTTHDRMDDYWPGWEREERSRLEALVENMESFRLRTYPVLTEELVLNLTVQRLPLCDMAKPEDSPEIPSLFHMSLLHWAKYKAYAVDDVDANDPKKSASGYALFREQFGDSTAQEEHWLRQQGGRDLMNGELLT